MIWTALLNFSFWILNSVIALTPTASETDLAFITAVKSAFDGFYTYFESLNWLFPMDNIFTAVGLSINVLIGFGVYKLALRILGR